MPLEMGNDQVQHVRNFKEQYWTYSLIVIILLLGIVIFWQFTPLLAGQLGASRLHILLRNHALNLSEPKHWKQWVMALV